MTCWWFCLADPRMARTDDAASRVDRPLPAGPNLTRAQRLGADTLIDEMTRYWTRRHEAERLSGHRPPPASLSQGLFVLPPPGGTTRAVLDRVEWLLRHRVGLLIYLDPPALTSAPTSLAHLREAGREGGLRLLQTERWRPVEPLQPLVVRKHDLWLRLRQADRGAMAELTEVQASWPVGEGVPTRLRQLSDIVLDFQRRRPGRTVVVQGLAGAAPAGMLVAAVQVRRRMAAGERGDALFNGLRDALLQWQDHCGEPRSLAVREALLPLLALCEQPDAEMPSGQVGSSASKGPVAPITPTALAVRSTPPSAGPGPQDSSQAAAPRGGAG